MNSHNTTSTMRTISHNKKALHDYAIEQRFEAGLMLEGWEVKSIRAGRVQLKDSYVVFKRHEAFLLNAHFSPLLSTSTHLAPDPMRSRKLLLHRKELNVLIGAVQRQGYTLIPLSLYWKHHHVKLEFALAKGKKQYDKRESEKKRDWERQKQRLMKHTR